MAQIFTPVRPGDPITADFMNRILTELNSLEDRVASLETGLPSSDAVSITALIPDGPLQIGQELQVVGRNFGFLAGTNRVTIDGVPVNAFKLGTSDQRLIFDIPQIANIPATGRLAILVVTNLRTSAQRSILLLSAPVVLIGAVDVLWTDIQPSTMTPGSAVTFRYKLRSRTNIAATYTITPAISGVTNLPAWQSQLVVLDSFQNPLASREVRVEAGQEKEFGVRITAVPPGTNGVTFNLATTATAETITGSDGPRAFTVGQPIQPEDPTIIPTTPAMDAATSGSSLDTSTTPFTIRVPANGSMRIAVTFSLHVIGTYTVTTNVNSGPNWTAILHPQTTPPTFDVTSQDLQSSGGEFNRLLKFIVQANPGAAATGEVEFRVQRTGGPPARTLRLKTALL